ncbi:MULTISPECIES: class I SAM-dependent methyltransferase [unclassified Streptomyces]|uniref:class I SAM-dependent methyltransferase n=1 Tax=unclassified Streptomyces TaxID=2593676 RepID=UPI00278BE8C0|nr:MULTISPECIES: hypothetical protein [unclassified Streptomyces]
MKLNPTLAVSEIPTGSAVNTSKTDPVTPSQGSPTNKTYSGKSAQSVTLHMSGEESKLFKEYLAGRHLYLEFGCGGSTVAAAQAGIQRIVSVESDLAWINMLREHPSLGGKDVTFHHADVGETGAWGKPTSDRYAFRWPTYSQIPWAELGDAVPDVVLVDGRWRVACALQTIVRCPPTTLLMFHDFWKRGHYHGVLNYTDHVATAGTLAVLRPRQNVDFRALATDLATHTLDYR